MLNIKAYLVSLAVLAALCIVFVLAWPYIIANPAHLQQYLLGAILVSIVLVVVNVLQISKNSEDVESLTTHLTQDIFTSSHELLSELYRSSPVPYVLVDKMGTVTSTNISAVRLFDITEGDLDGKNIFDFIEGDNAQHVALFPEKLLRGLFVNDEEVRIVRSDGTTRWTMCSIFSFVDDHGERNGLVTLVDISKQKQIDRAKTEFVSLASHQLRTPIASVKWNLELLLMKHQAEISAPARGYVDHALGGVEQMNTLVADFLNASRFELGTLQYKKESVNVPAFIDKVVADYDRLVIGKKITVVKDYAPNVTTFSSDPQLLLMIVNNLLSNAVKYTPAEGTITVKTVMEQNTVRIIIADTGMGIPKGEQDRLFTKIFRATNAAASVPDGTGLGLYIAQEAAKVLGGEITCVSDTNKGTTFMVMLPA